MTDSKEFKLMTDGGEEETVFQRLVTEDGAQNMMDDLEDLETLTPEETDPDEIQQWELALSFTLEDLPYILEELEDKVDDGE